MTQNKLLKSSSLWSSLPGERKHVTRPSSTPSIYQLLQIFTCVTSPPQERKKALHSLLLSPPSPSIHPHPVAAVIPPLLLSLCPFWSVWQPPSVANSRKQTDGRTERGGDRLGGFLTPFLPPTLSHQISMPFLIDPSSSLFCSLSVPLNLSFVFCRLTVAAAHHLTQSSAFSPCAIHPPSLTHLPPSVSIAYILCSIEVYTSS